MPVCGTYTVSVVLYKRDLDCLEELIGRIKEARNKSGCVILADQENTEEACLELMKEASKKFDIKSSDIAFSKILELAKTQLQNEGSDNN